MRTGVDEAGKGPVLGPMVAAAVRANPGALPNGIRDSKRLPVERRETIAAALRSDSAIEVGIAVVPVERIDDPETDMNSLTVAAQAEALSTVLGGRDVAEEDVAKGHDGDRDVATEHVVVLDAGDVNESRFARRVREAVDANGDGQVPAFELLAEHGADDTHPIVGAASIVAKVERDRRVAELADEYGEIGSGYPSDPTTRSFLAEYVAEHDELPACARASWQTAADVLAAAEQSSLAEF